MEGSMRKCDESPPGQLLLGIRQFNAREWYDCHETLEDLWIGETGEVRNLLQGIIQISVALHHWHNGNHGGAVGLLESGINYLKRVPDACLWIDVAALAADAGNVRNALETLGREEMGSLDAGLIPLIKTVSLHRA